MPILPVKKEGGQDYRPVQDLRLVQKKKKKKKDLRLVQTLVGSYILMALA